MLFSLSSELVLSSVLAWGDDSVCLDVPGMGFCFLLVRVCCFHFHHCF